MERTGTAFGAKAVTCALALFLVLNGLVLNGALWLAAGPEGKNTVLPQARDMMLARSGDDSWGPMAAALDHARAPHATPLYSEIFFERGIRFQYPPSALFALAAMRLAGPERVRTSDDMVFEGWPPINDLLGWLFVTATALCSWALLELRLRQTRAVAGPDRLAVARLLVVVGLTVTFYPVVKSFTLGQVQVWINAAFAASLLAWALGRKALSGCLIGLICLIKPHYGLFVLWGALRREWRFVMPCAATLGAGLAASVAAFGWADHLDYLRVLSFIAERGEAYYPNQSVNGLLNRLMSIGEPGLYRNLAFGGGGFPPYTPAVYWGTLASSLALLLAALAHVGAARDRVLEFCILTASLTLAAPIAWEHHYGVFLPVFAAILPGVLRSPKALVMVAACYLLIATSFFPFVNRLAATPLNVVQSYVFAAGLALLVFMHSRLRRCRAGAN